MKRYWLVKSEPDEYSIDDLEQDRIAPWDGIRNYQARNIIRNEIKVNDEILIYHTGRPAPGVAGVGRIVRAAYPDSTALDKTSAYYDERATDENPIWYCVDIEFVGKFTRFVPLSEIKSTAGLEEMMIVRRGNRLSVQPVRMEHFKKIVQMGNREQI